MDEHQALLGRTVRSSLFGPVTENKETWHSDAPAQDFDPGGGSSSEGSESWWEDSHSSCSSCFGSSHTSEEEWEEAVAENGDLMYIEPAEQNISSVSADGKDELQSQPAVPVLPAITKPLTDKQGKFVRWIRRRESKRQRPRLSLVAEKPGVAASSAAARSAVKLVTVDIPRLHGKLDVLALGLQLSDTCVVSSVAPDGLLANCERIEVGDVLKSVNNEEVTRDTLEKHLGVLLTPCQIILGFQKSRELSLKPERTQSKLVQRLLEGDVSLQSRLSKLPIAVMAIDMAELQGDTADSDLVYCYPDKSSLAATRGAFITLSHLLPSVVGSQCKSATCEVKDEKAHVVFSKEDDLLLLVVIPDRLCKVEEACLFTNDLVRCLCFIHQTLQCCFKKDKPVLEKWFSSLFARVLSCESTGLPDVPLGAVDPLKKHFHQFLSAAVWVPLPREAQLQLDDALNELESCDFGNLDDDVTESERQFLVLGSCLYHRACLLSSHLSKEDLMDVHSLLRQQGLLDLSRNEGVTRLVIWREVFPHSVNRGLPPTSPAPPTAYPPPVGRWFVLVVSTGHDMLAVLLENSGCCVPLPENPRPHPAYVREAEDTLAHVQSLGLTNLAAQWLDCQARPATTATTPCFQRPIQKEKAWGPLPKPANRPTEPQEDTFSQAASNVSNPSNTSNASESDENAPILGRRAERSGVTVAASMGAVRELSDESSDSSDSDSDWGSFKGLGLQDNSSGLFDNPYLPSNVGGMDEITPSKITSGVENQLFHFVYVDGNEGVVMCPGVDGIPPAGLMAKFTSAAYNIHQQLQHNVRFRASADPRGVVNKSLIAVKECGLLLDPGQDEKLHWVVGRLFFTPQPREVYVCYSDDAPQNMLELAFRLGIGAAG